jgi:succinylglutamate desuccinylase
MQAIKTVQNDHTQNILRHFIGDIRGDYPGPTVVAVAGIHGNEPTGIESIVQVIQELEPLKEFIHGRFIGLQGNITALENNVRFVDEDMNRLWVRSILDKIRRTPFDELHTADRIEVKELLAILDPLVETDEKLIYVDLHTFSGTGGMFSITPKEERHIDLLSQLKIPLIFGIEHTLLGTSMEYVEDAGHIGFAFESGTHGTMAAEVNAVAGIMTLLVVSGVIPPNKLPKFSEYYAYLMEKVEGLPHKADFVYKHIIEEDDEFVMNPGFHNFDKVVKGDWLATDRHGKIEAQLDGYLLMPLYQKQGNDGFFIVRECE